MKKLIYYSNILNYVICDLLVCIYKSTNFLDLLIRHINPSSVQEDSRKDCLWFFGNHSITFLVLFTVPATLMIAYFLKLFTHIGTVYIIETGFLIQVIFIIFVYFISHDSDYYFKRFENIRNLKIKKWRKHCFIFALVDFAIGLFFIYLFLR